MKLALSLFLLCTLVHAHGLKIFATVEEGLISGYVYTAGGGRIPDAALSVLCEDEEVITTVKTDKDGIFSYQPTRRCRHLFVLKTKDGHEARYAITAAEIILPQEDHPDSTEVLELREQVHLLNAKLATQQLRTRFRDVLGGIGFIFGIMGMTLYFRIRKVLKKKENS